MRMSALALVPLALLVFALACGPESIPGPDSQAIESVRGPVQDVQARSLLEIESLTVRDDAGRGWKVEGRGKSVEGFTPSHLGEHMVLRQPVTVDFYRDGEALVLVDITD